MADRKVISIDGMGGDNAPRIVVEGIERIARTHPHLDFLVHGDEVQLKALLLKAPTAAPRVTIRHTDKSVAMDAKPSQMLRQGKGTSMWSAIESVKAGEAVAAVSAGNTGALMALSMFILRKVEGVHRPGEAFSNAFAKPVELFDFQIYDATCFFEIIHDDSSLTCSRDSAL